ncbi:DUF6091 family protein [Marinobacteraceae bacterium S3BR75-40.1]
MKARTLFLLLSVFLVSLQAQAAKTLCVFDVIGANGDAYKLMKRYALEAKALDIDFQLKPYTDEGVALGDFLSGQCDVLAATDLRIRRFNRFTGSVSAVGAIPTYDELRTVLMTLARPKAAKYMTEGDYEILGIVPLGAGYLFVDDRGINTAAKLAGKKMATLDYQKDAIHMVNYVNGTVVPSDITNFGGKFNNGMVDAAYAPAWAYEALELYKGIGEQGGVVDYPLAQLTMQLVAKDDLVGPEKAQKLREIAAGLFDQAMDVIKRHEKRIPEKDWIKIPQADIEDYQEMFRQNRLELRDGKDSDGNVVPQVYHPTMLTLLRKVRCQATPSAHECTAADRE